MKKLSHELLKSLPRISRSINYQLLIFNYQFLVLLSALSVLVVRVPAQTYQPTNSSTYQPFVFGESGGYTQMQNYNTEQGLPVSNVISSCADNFGNLWFGTLGGGVSRYDGKSFTNFITKHGLANNDVRCIMEDKSGNIWFGTFSGGVSKYDGKCFTSFTMAHGLASNEVRCLLEDKSGDIWLGTYKGGVCRFRPTQSNLKSSSGVFVNFTTAQGLANNTVWSMIEDRNGNLWFATNGGGVSKYSPVPGDENVKFKNLDTSHGLAHNVVRCIAEDKSGNLWFGTYGGGVSKYSRPKSPFSGVIGKFTNFTTEHGLIDNVVLSIEVEENGIIWFGTYNGGVSRYTPTQISFAADGGVFTNFTTAQGLINNEVRSISKDKKGNLWFCTNGGGISRYDGKCFTNFTTVQGLANNKVCTITEDKSGNLWFGTYGGGVSKFDGKEFTNYSKEHGMAHDRIWSSIVDKTGNLWFGTYGGGVSKYTPRKNTLEQGGGFYTNFTTTQGLVNNDVRSIAEDRWGNIWFGTYGGGVSKYISPQSTHQGRMEVFTNFTSAHGLTNNVVKSILADKFGNIWLGTYGGGVSRYTPPQVSDEKGLGEFTNFTTENGLPSDRIWCILEEKSGILWFGTDGGGVSRYDGKSFINFATAPHFPDGVVYAIVQDKTGKLWFGSNLGIGGLSFNSSTHQHINSSTLSVDNALTNEELKRYIPVWDIYNTQNGYPVKGVNSGQNSMYCDSKGIIWIGTGDDKTGLVRFDPSALKKSIEPPKVIIKQLSIDEKVICWYTLQITNQRITNKYEYTNIEQGIMNSTTLAQQEMMTYSRVLSKDERDSVLKRYDGIIFDSIGRFYAIPYHLELPYKHNNVTFEFNAIEPTKPYLINYKYMLEGYSKEWVSISNSQSSFNRLSANFGNIDQGNYTFKIKAQSPDGVWCEPVCYDFKVLPPWYQTWLFYSLQFGGIIILFGVVLLLKYSKFNWADRTAVSLATVSMFIIFEYLQNYVEINFEGILGGVVLFKVLLNVILALLLIPAERIIRGLLRLQDKKLLEDIRKQGKMILSKKEIEVITGDKIKERIKLILQNMLTKKLTLEQVSEYSGIEAGEVKIILDKN